MSRRSGQLRCQLIATRNQALRGAHIFSQIKQKAQKGRLERSGPRVLTPRQVTTGTAKFEFSQMQQFFRSWSFPGNFDEGLLPENGEFVAASDELCRQLFEREHAGQALIRSGD